MLCPKCGIYNAEHAPTCLRCGCALTAERPARRKKKLPKQSTGVGSMVAVGIFVVLSIVLVILTFAFR